MENSLWFVMYEVSSWKILVNKVLALTTDGSEATPKYREHTPSSTEPRSSNKMWNVLPPQENSNMSFTVSSLLSEKQSRTRCLLWLLLVLSVAVRGMVQCTLLCEGLLSITMCLRLLVKWVSSLFLLTDGSKPLGVDATLRCSATSLSMDV